MSEEAKKAERLEKNRQAAKECRKKKKAYISDLEAKVRLLEMQNTALVAELEKARASLTPDEQQRLKATIAGISASRE